MNKTILITRPLEDYAETASMVMASGFDPVACPMLRVEPVGHQPPEADRYQALVFTSPRGVDHLAAGPGLKELPVYTVGDRTADVARQAGYVKVTSAGADLNALEALLFLENLSPDKPLLHVCGEDVVRPIAVPGRRFESLVVYHAVQAEELPAGALAVIQDRAPYGVLFYSARTAEAFVAAVKKGSLQPQFMTTRALCLADTMIESLRGLPWRSIVVAQRPDRSGMQALLDAEKGTNAIMNAQPESLPESPAEQDQNAISPAEPVIERFGGIRPMATKMNVPVTTVQGWKKRNVIPGNRRDDVIEAARTHGIQVQELLGQVAVPAAAPQSFRQNVQVAAAHMTPADQARHDDAVAKAAKIEEELRQTRLAHQALLQSMKDAEKNAVRKSALVSVILLSVVGLSAAVLLGPGRQGTFKEDVAAVQEIQALRSDIAKLDGDVETMRTQQKSLKDLIPAEVTAKIEDIKATAEDMQNRVGEIKQQVETATEVAKAAKGIASDVLGPDGGDLQQRLSSLESQVQNLTGSSDLSALIARIAELQQSPEGQNLLSMSTGQLNTLIASLGGDMSKFESALQLQQGTNTELGNVMQGVSPADMKAATLLLGLSQFRSSLNRNAPFDEDLKLLENVLGADDPALQEAIKRLAPQASKGVLTPAGLSDELKSLAGEIVVSSIKGEDVSIREKAAARMNDLFQVEKNGELVTGTDTQARIARAQKMLDAGNIDDAVTELQALQGPARETAQPVIDEAQMTLLAQQVQELLSQGVSGHMRGGSGMKLPSLPDGLDVDSLMESIESISGGVLGTEMFGPFAPGQDLMEGLNSGFGGGSGASVVRPDGYKHQQYYVAP
jgi:uroporphyrinogen-III synthase